MHDANTSYPVDSTADILPEGRGDLETRSSPIFVGGSGRCGTTILGRTLGLSERVYTLPDEPHFLSDDGGLIHWARQPHDSDLAASFVKHMTGDFYSRWAPRAGRPAGLCSYVDKNHLERCLADFLKDFPDTTPEGRFAQIRDFVNSLYEPTLARHGATRWCDDSPLNVLCLTELSRVFPKMKFLHIIRDGRAVARSYCRLGWCKNTRQAITLWASRVRRGRGQARGLSQHRYREVSFEKLVADPGSELREILTFCGERWSEELDHHKISGERARAFSGSSPYTDEENQILEEIAGDLMAEFAWTT